MFGLTKIAFIGACYLALFFTCVLGQDTEVVLSGDVGFYIESGEKVEIHGSLLGENNAVITNNGQVNLNSSHDIEINVVESEALFSGQGEYALVGSREHVLDGRGNALKFRNLTIDKDDASYDVVLYSDLVISNRLSLFSGIVNGRIGNGSSVYVTNPSSNSVRYISPEDDKSNIGFVDGVFYQNVLPDSTYFLPVGADGFYTPLKVTNQFNNISQLRAEFSYGTIAEMENTIHKSYLKFNELMTTGLWHLSSNIDPVEGQISMDAYFFNFNDYLSIEDNMFAIVHNNEPTTASNAWNLAGEMPLGGMPSRRANSLKANASHVDELGYFGIAKADLYKLINLISPGDGRETTVIIPNIDKYDETELIVFDSFGSKVFESKPYTNNLNMKSYRDGTYYYIFNFVKDGERGTIQSYIDVKSKY